ncbi:MAG: hypothetical protein ACKO0Z_13605, partial [Betaproteobacteria bacterium]
GIFCANFKAIIDVVKQYCGMSLLSFNETEQSIYSVDSLSLPPSLVPLFVASPVTIGSAVAPNDIDAEPLKGFSYGRYVIAYPVNGVITYCIADGQGKIVKPFSPANGLMGWTGGSYGKSPRITASTDGGFYLLGYKDAYTDPVSNVTGNWLVAQKYNNYGALDKELCFGKGHIGAYTSGKISRLMSLTFSGNEYLVGCYILTRAADSIQTLRYWIYDTVSGASIDGELFAGDTAADTVTDFKFSANATNAQVCFTAAFSAGSFRSISVDLATGATSNASRYTATGTTATHGAMRICATLYGGWLVSFVLSQSNHAYYLLGSNGAQLGTISGASSAGGITQLGEFICGSNGYIGVPMTYVSGGQYFPGFHVVNAQASAVSFVNRWDASVTTNIYGNSYYELSAFASKPASPPVTWSSSGDWDSGVTSFTGYVAYDAVAGYNGDANTTDGRYLKVTFSLAVGYATVSTVTTAPARIAGSMGHAKPVQKSDGTWSGKFLSIYQVYSDYTLKTPCIKAGYLPN